MLDDTSVLSDPARLEALRRTDLLDSPAEEVFDRYTRLVTRIVGVPVALLSLVDDRRQFIKSSVGLAEPWLSARAIALSHSLCRYVVADDAVLRADDARQHDRLRDNPAIEDFGIGAYLGAPVHGPGGHAIGSLCVIDPEPRRWRDDDLDLLADLADVTSELVGIHTAAVERRAAAIELSHRVRSGLTSLQLEADEAAAALPEPAQSAVQRLADGLQAQSAQLAEGLRQLEHGALGHEEPVDLVTVLRAVAAGTTRPDRLVVLEDGDVPPLLRAAPGDLARVVREVVQVLLQHGRGPVRLRVLADAGWVRVRVQDDSEGLPPEVTRGLTARSDGGAEQVSLAERTARLLGGRLALLGGGPTTVELLVPVGRS